MFVYFRVARALVPEGHEVTVNVNHILAVKRNTIASFVLLAYPFWKQPVKDAEVNVPGLKLPTEILQVLL